MFEKAVSEDSNLFGSTSDLNQCQVAIIPVPWEATTSYRQGTAKAPNAVKKASHQLDFFEKGPRRNLEDPIYMLPENPLWLELNQRTLESVREFRKTDDHQVLEAVNQSSGRLNKLLFEEVTGLLKKGKKVGILGGDHSSPLGSIQAIAQHVTAFGVLHFDAHHDLRENYEGFQYSHASIMFQALRTIPGLETLVSIGIRDFSEEEFHRAEQDPRIATFYDSDLKSRLFKGETWFQLCQEVVDLLPSYVYISMDIDGLDPKCCPHTGTPVPGGLSFDQAVFLLDVLRASGKQILGFDLCEVAPDPDDINDSWDSNVGARILHRLCSLLYDNGFNFQAENS